MAASEEPLPTSPQALFSCLDSMAIPYRVYDHDPVFTVAESEHLKAHIPGLHCRNLFVRDKKEKMFLITVADDVPVDLKGLEKILDCRRLSFGSAERMWRHLGVRPGHVCPFAAINDRDCAVLSVLDAGMMRADEIAVHPMENHMTIVLKPADLLKFLEFTGHKPHIADLKGNQAP